MQVTKFTGQEWVVGVTVPSGVVRVRRQGKTCWTGNSGRELGSYSNADQPAKGGSEGAQAKRMGSLDCNALLSHGACEVLRDIQVIKGSKNENYWNALKLGRPLPEPGVPFIYDKFVALLKAGGANVTRKGDAQLLTSLTDADIDKMAAGEIRNSDTVDSATLKPKVGGLFDEAVTGGTTGRQWGKVTLQDPLPNPAMEEPIRRLLGLTVKDFRAVLAGRQELEGQGTGGRAIMTRLAGLGADLDGKINFYRNEAMNTRGARRDNAIKCMRYLANAKRQGTPLTAWMLTRVPVLPPVFRPVSKMGDMLMSADINDLYRDLIENNNHIKDAQGVLPESELCDARDQLYDSLQAVMGWGEASTEEGRAKKLKGAVKSIFGDQPKHGLWQHNVTSKTMDLVARGTIAPDPDLDMDSIGIPEDKAWQLYKPFVSRVLVQRGFPPVKVREMLDSKSKDARDVLQKVMHDRPVIVNRAPSWHKFNVMAFEPFMTDENVIRVSPLVCSGFNADFNGDSCEDLDILCQVDSNFFYGKISELLDKYLIPGYNEDQAVSRFGKCTASFKVKPGRIKMIGLNASGNSELVAIDGFSIHMSHGPDCYRVETASGLSGVFTAHHSFSVVDPVTAELKEVKTDTLKVGTLLPAARNFELPETVAEAPGAPTRCPLTYLTGFWFGHYLGDGALTGRQDTISQASTDPDLLGYLTAIGDAFMPVKAWREGNGFSTRWTNIPWYDYLAAFGMKCDGKGIPAWMFAAPKEFKLGLIAGMYIAEGSPDRSGGYRFEIVNRRMLVQFKTLIEALGGICRLSDGKPERPRRKASYVLRTNIRTFIDAGIKFPEALNISRKFTEEEPPERDNWDLVPFPAVVSDRCRSHAKKLSAENRWQVRRGEPSRQSRCSDVDSKQFSKAMKDGWCTRKFAVKVIEGYALEAVKDEPAIGCWLNIVHNKSVYWTPVEAFTKVERPDVTYDFSVPDMHLFGVDGTTLVHNSMNFHVPVGDKAVKEAWDKMRPSVNLFKLTDLKSPQHMPSKELLLGLYQMTREPSKAKPVVFNTSREAQEAYTHGLIQYNDPIIIKETGK